MQFFDSTTARAHVSAAGAKGGSSVQALGRSRGGFSTKIHLKTDLDGNPLDFHLTGGEVSDSTQFETSLDIGPDIRPRIAITDKGYDSQANRAAALARGITPVIPRRENSKQRGRFFPKRLYKLRPASNRRLANSSGSNASPCGAKRPTSAIQPLSVLRAA
ncbi:MAG: transposase [Rhodospirillales bacterium]